MLKDPKMEENLGKMIFIWRPSYDGVTKRLLEKSSLTQFDHIGFPPLKRPSYRLSNTCLSDGSLHKRLGTHQVATKVAIA